MQQSSGQIFSVQYPLLPLPLPSLVFTSPGSFLSKALPCEFPCNCYFSLFKEWSPHLSPLGPRFPVSISTLLHLHFQCTHSSNYSVPTQVTAAHPRLFFLTDLIYFTYHFLSSYSQCFSPLPDCWNLTIFQRPPIYFTKFPLPSVNGSCIHLFCILHGTWFCHYYNFLYLPHYQSYLRVGALISLSFHTRLHLHSDWNIKKNTINEG